jgi:hypothetical protein
MTETPLNLPNHWTPYNLLESPFFQADLRSTGSGARMSLFVGRQREAQRLLAAIGGASSSRQTVEGQPGFGKTTLTQYVKATAAEAGYASYPDPVSAAGIDNAETLVLRLLRYAYDALTSRLGETVLAHPAVEASRRLLFDTRLRDIKTAAQVAGFGFDREVVERTEPAVFQSSLLSVPALLRQLPDVAEQHGLKGIVVHLNNLENLVTEAQRAQAGSALRDLRDLFLVDGFHFILVGTPDAVRSLISPHPQLRTVFGIGRPLEALSRNDFLALLARRYAHLRRDRNAEVRPPVEHEAAAEVYRVYRGDLRGALRALEEATQELIGYAGPPGTPITARALFGVLVPMLIAETDATLSDNLQDRFYALREVGEGEFTQRDLVDLWEIAQPTVSEYLRELQRQGYVHEARRQGRQIWYALTGHSRLVLGIEHPQT